MGVLLARAVVVVGRWRLKFYVLFVFCCAPFTTSSITSFLFSLNNPSAKLFLLLQYLPHFLQGYIYLITLKQCCMDL